MSQQPTLEQLGRPLTLVPVGLKEAALDSPTFRAGITHFSEQVELIEKWLENYVRSITKLSHEIATLEGLVNGVLNNSVPPSNVSEAIIDHDYTLLAAKTYGEGVREDWLAMISGWKNLESTVADPIRQFMKDEIRSYKDIRRQLEQSQKQLDSLQSRYSAQTKAKEPSSLREDAFQLHEARKTYLKASMDFSVMAPQLRTKLDKMLVKLFSEQWQDMRTSRNNTGALIGKLGSDIERVRGWSREMEGGEKAFARELLQARKEIEESAEAAVRPSRELEDYSTSGSKGPSTTSLQAPDKSGPTRSGKQGWLNLRTVTGKPSRTVWIRRWFFVKNGIFSWLVQGSRSGGVEESARIGVLLCSVRPATTEERRFCFEIKTTNHSIVVQADTQPELQDWIGAFETAKQKALQDPSNTDSPGLEGPRAQDAAFAISAPSAPEFAASAADSGMQQFGDDNGLERNLTLPTLGGEPSSSLASRSSFDVSVSRRSAAGERDVESNRDPATRMKQKLDLHRKFPGGPAPPSPGLSGGGIASLIAASHNVMPVGPGVPSQPPVSDGAANRISTANIMRDLPANSLAPNTLVNPPAPTNLSAVAVIVNGEKGIGMGRIDATGGMPNGVMANVWGTSSLGYLNRIERGQLHSPQDQRSKLSNPSTPTAGSPSAPSVGSHLHPKSTSLEGDQPGLQKANQATREYPKYYPLQLRTQDAQFRLLFPNISRQEALIFVFRATWNLNEQQEFPGRVYATMKNIYFYSNHLGLVLTSGVCLGSISEVTAAPGKDCDFLFLHLKDTDRTKGSIRITVKTFLEPLKLLQRRLNLIIRLYDSPDTPKLESIMKRLIDLEQEDSKDSPSLESWEDVSMGAPHEESSAVQRNTSQQHYKDLKATVHIDQGLYGASGKLDEGRDITKFKLPRQPVVYVPPGMNKAVVDKIFDVSPKALFHVMFGDRSAVWQLLYHERRAQRIKQGSWAQLEQSHLRREFEYDVEYLDLFRRVNKASIVDYQLIDVLNDHLCYVITDRKTPWHLPYRQNFTLLSKMVITHVAKSRCRLAIYNQVDWFQPPGFGKAVIESRALSDLELDSLDLADVISDQVRKLGAQARTKKSVQIFGHVGQQVQASEFAGSESPLVSRVRRSLKHRTITGLYLESFGSLLESIAISLVRWFTGLVQCVWKILNAHTILIGILTISVLTNVMHSSKDTSTWWSERKAGNFMTRLGVGPSFAMSKAVYMQDLDDALIGDNPAFSKPRSKCHETFQVVVHNTDMDSPYQSAAYPLFTSGTKAAAHRLRRTRQRLGSYRHDLLVAMRVVNKIEGEMMHVEWENWLLDEVTNCKALEIMVGENRTNSLASRNGLGSMQATPAVEDDHDRLREIRVWLEEYCGSCNREQEKVLGRSIKVNRTS